MTDPLDALVGQIIDLNGQTLLVNRRVGNLLEVRTEAACVPDATDRLEVLERDCRRHGRDVGRAE